jgi:predicted dehydrogenase
VQDLIGQNALVVDSTSRVIRGDDVPADLAARSNALQTEMIAAAIGPAAPELNTAYLLMLGLASHDVSAMRELIGLPRGVLFATQRWAGRWMSAALDYGSFVCELAIGVDTVPRMDAYLQFHTGSKVIRVEYDTPYVRNLPARLIVAEPKNGVGLSHAESFATRQDSFVLEWTAFHDNIAGGHAPKTSLADSREDLVLFKQLIDKMRA